MLDYIWYGIISIGLTVLSYATWQEQKNSRDLLEEARMWRATDSVKSEVILNMADNNYNQDRRIRRMQIVIDSLLTKHKKEQEP